MKNRIYFNDAEYDKAYRDYWCRTFPHKVKEKSRLWRLKHPELKEQYTIQRRKYNKLHPDKVKHWNLQKDFGISLLQYKDLYNNQNGLCAICNQPKSFTRCGKILSLAVDHCHKTGIIRGLLCRYCNLGLGNFKDNSIYLKRAANYVSTL